MNKAVKKSSIPEHEGIYEIHTNGLVWSIKKGRYLANPKNKTRYHFITLLNNGKRSYHTVHRIVANAFIPNPENKPQINHINGLKNDNRVENLEWCNASENCLHFIRIGVRKIKSGSENALFGRKGHLSNKKRSVKKIDFITGEELKVYPTLTLAAKDNNVVPSAISNCCNGSSKKCAGFGWEYNSQYKTQMI